MAELAVMKLRYLIPLAALVLYWAGSVVSERIQIAKERREQCSAVYERNVRCLIVRVRE